MENIKKLSNIAYSIAHTIETKIVKKEKTQKWQNYLACDYVQFAVFSDKDNNFLLFEDYYDGYRKIDGKDYYRKVGIVLRPFRRLWATHNGEYKVELESTVFKAGYTIKGYYYCGVPTQLVTFTNPQSINEDTILKDLTVFEQILEFVKNTEIE